MVQRIADGTERLIDGHLRVHYEGYWIRAYPIPSDTLLEKRRLIETLTRRLFNHVEHGLYVPGKRLEEARRAFEAESDHARKRVKGGMLAAALFNRATDILTKLVEIQALGVDMSSDDPLMRLCGEHLREALDLPVALADDAELAVRRSDATFLPHRWREPLVAGHRAAGRDRHPLLALAHGVTRAPGSRSRAAAISTASKILV